MAYLTLIEWQVPGEGSARRYSFEGVRAPVKYYKPLLLQAGIVRVEINPLGGELRLGDLQLTFDDSSREFSTILGTTAVFHNTITCLHGDEDGGLAALKPIFFGRINSWNSAKGQLRVNCRDERMGFFQQPLRNLFPVLNIADYPNIPENIKLGELIPIPFGALVSTADLPIGHVPGYLVDPAVGQTKYRYVIASIELKDVTAVYRYGVLITTGFVTTIAAGRTYLDFNSDQRAVDSISNRDYSRLVVSHDLVSRWLLDEGTGTTANDDIASNDGTLTGDAVFAEASFGASYADLAAGYINVARHASLNLTGDFTVCVWVDLNYGPGIDGGRRVIFDNGEELNVKGWSFYWNASHQLEFRSNTAAANQKTTSAAGFAFGPEEQFVMLTCRNASGVVSFFYHDRPMSDFGGYAAQPTHTTPVTPTASFKMGTNDDANTLRSAIKQGRVYNAALTDAEIQSLARIPYNPEAFTQENEIEITADVEGLTDDDTSSGNLVVKPPEQLKRFLEICGVVSGQINSSLFTQATAHSDLSSFAGAFCLLDKDQTLAQVLNEFNDSWNMPLVVDVDGKYGAIMFAVVDPASETPLPVFRDDADVLEDSFAQRNNERPASTIRYNHTFQSIKQMYELREELTDAGQVTVLGRDVIERDQLDLIQVHDATMALEVATARLNLQRADRIPSEFALRSTEFQHQIGRLLYLTHYLGADSGGGGYVEALCRIIRKEIDLSPKSGRVKLQVLKVEET
jgi:hypothetical protein